ncbi:MAG: tRNA epoxyqueuosine(34) reductase QueG, partial [Planctomycetaceae bacterium]|nr:tRNA epoxyqueuosine(34) reductase QueG [Planctomycetaceae bacterium]
RWIDDGFHAGMDYLAKNMEIRADPQRLLPGAKSLLMLGVSYQTVLESEPEIRRLFFSCEEQDALPIADYASGIDYHLWIRKRLNQLAHWHRQWIPQGRCRGCVDTAPLLERQYAQNAGLGKIGKNTMLIHPNYGSRFFLAALLTTEELEPTQPLPFDPCSDCQRCQNVCASGALGEPHRLDARKCVNYWTIEHGDGLSNVSFGCDLCQNACPWNREKLPSGRLSRKMLQETEPDELKSRFAQTPLLRKISRTGR